VLPRDYLFILKHGCSHRYAQLFYLIRTRNDAAVIVGKHSHWNIRQIRLKHALARNIKIIAVY